MCSYNRVNGSQACQNSKALNGLLKGELGFQGYVVSDWGAVYSGVTSIEAGLDMNQPGGMGLFGSYSDPASYFGDNVTEAVNNGTIDVARLDDMVTRIMTPYYFLGQDQDFPTVDPSSGIIYQYAGAPSTVSISPLQHFLQKYRADCWNLVGTRLHPQWHQQPRCARRPL